jgi:eukaryotic-like serine/threonine-protein kinase
MGEVYRATDTALERTVAVKLLSDRYAQQDEARARFQREALAAARLSAAPNVVTVFDVAEHRGRPLIVMEYLEGGSVYERLRDGRVPSEQALQWLEQTADALDRAHASGVVHRDVKPANLLLDRDGNVHVSDFGIASASGADMLTAPGTVLGTAGYISPEQARGEPATPASDRYSLAVVAFELLTGRRPFAGDTPTTEAFAHLNASVPRAGAVDPTLPPALDAVFETALAKDPAERPATARELVQGLREAFEPEPVTPTKVVVPPPRGQSTRGLVRRDHDSHRRRVASVVLAALVLVAAGIGIAALAARDGHPAKGAQGTSPPHRTSQATSTEETTTEESPTADGVALANQGYALQQAGNYAAALPLLRQAVLALTGSGLVEEAYADYNLAFTRFAADPNRCDGVLGLLARSERIQGQRDEIDQLRRQWEERCSSSDEQAAPGHGRAKGKGKGKGHDG